jgi:predicted transcriptional regulator
MSGATRFQLKQPTGWFAAGREVRCALELLSDATFKLFVWLCLHAERGRGALSATPAELAKALGRKENDIHLALEELERQGVCTLRADGVIEIRDRFCHGINKLKLKKQFDFSQDRVFAIYAPAGNTFCSETPNQLGSMSRPACTLFFLFNLGQPTPCMIVVHSLKAR